MTKIKREIKIPGTHIVSVGPYTFVTSKGRDWRVKSRPVFGVKLRGKLQPGTWYYRFFYSPAL